MFEILNAAEMKLAEARATEQGVSGFEMMTAAGVAAAETIAKTFKPRPVLVLCGPGNNGGDGFIVAQHLKKLGWPLRVACMVKRDALKGDALLAAQQWDGEIEALDSNLSVHKTGLVVDAVFGTGFDMESGRALAPELALLFDKIRTRKIPVVAIDIPSGVDAATGAADPAALKARLTATFCRKKYGHVLLPGKSLCGAVSVIDIGITDETIAALETHCFENAPALWLKHFPRPNAESHKYTRGHALVYGGAKRTGAACLAAAAAQKTGAGLVTIAAPEKAWAVYSGYRASLMVDECDDIETWKALLRDERKNAVLLGCGAGTDERLRDAVNATLSINKSGVLDADVFTVFKDNPQELFAKLSPQYVLTPHEGEFEKLFGALEGSKTGRALKAAETAGAIILLKGADTVIAAPDGSTVINTGAPPTLATAGSGDVLAGMIAGLIAQGMPPFMAACAAVWLHGAAAKAYGTGLTAEDVISHLSQTLTLLFKRP